MPGEQNHYIFNDITLCYDITYTSYYTLMTSHCYIMYCVSQSQRVNCKMTASVIVQNDSHRQSTISFCTLKQFVAVRTLKQSCFCC